MTVVRFFRIGNAHAKIKSVPGTDGGHIPLYDALGGYAWDRVRFRGGLAFCRAARLLYPGIEFHDADDLRGFITVRQLYVFFSVSVCIGVEP